MLAVGNHVFASSSDYSTSVRLAMDRWLTDQKPSGFFPYGFDFLKDHESEPDTMSAANLTRQAGAAATLADYYALTGDQRTRSAIVKLLTAFGRHSLPIGKSPSQALVEESRLLSIPFGRYKLRNALERFGLLFGKSGPGRVLSPTSDYGKAYTGATALALLTELRYAQASRDDSYAGLRNAWLQGLMALWVPGEGFRQYPTSVDTTPFFDGEAWRALAEYHRAYPHDRRVNDLLPKVDAALMKSYGGEFKLAFFHWGAMAAAARYADTRDPKFLAFVRAQTRAFLYQRKDSADNDNNCAWVEGLADALGALLSAGEGDSELAGRARAWVAAEMHKTQQLQIQPKQQDIVFSNARIFAPRMQHYAGCFRSGIYAASTQVDFTGHCVSAMLKLQRNAGIRTGN
jgi:hypothetical protein